MTTKLTLRIDKTLVEKAKHEAKQRGKSVSGMVADYFAALGEETLAAEVLPPATASLYGIIKDAVSEEDYKRYLKDKHR